MKFIFPYIGNDKPTWLIFFRGVGIPPTRGSLTLVGKPLVLWWGEITRFFYLVSYFARRIIVRLLSWVVSTLQCVPLAIFHDHVYFETSVNEMGKTLATGLLMFFLITGDTHPEFLLMIIIMGIPYWWPNQYIIISRFSTIQIPVDSPLDHHFHWVNQCHEQVFVDGDCVPKPFFAWLRRHGVETSSEP